MPPMLPAGWPAVVVHTKCLLPARRGCRRAPGYRAGSSRQYTAGGTAGLGKLSWAYRCSRGPESSSPSSPRPARTSSRAPPLSWSPSPRRTGTGRRSPTACTTPSTPATTPLSRTAGARRRGRPAWRARRSSSALACASLMRSAASCRTMTGCMISSCFRADGRAGGGQYGSRRRTSIRNNPADYDFTRLLFWAAGRAAFYPR